MASVARLLKDAGCKVPLLCGPMYPGSNPELVAAVSRAGALGIVQPLSLTHLYGWDSLNVNDGARVRLFTRDDIALAYPQATGGDWSQLEPAGASRRTSSCRQGVFPS